MIQLIPYTVLSFFFCAIATVVILTIIHRFRVQLPFKANILIPFLMVGAFLLILAIGIENVYHLPSLYFVVFVFILMVLSIPVYIFSRL